MDKDSKINSAPDNGQEALRHFKILMEACKGLNPDDPNQRAISYRIHNHVADTCRSPGFGLYGNDSKPRVYTRESLADFAFIQGGYPSISELETVAKSIRDWLSGSDHLFYLSHPSKRPTQGDLDLVLEEIARRKNIQDEMYEDAKKKGQVGY